MIGLTATASDEFLPSELFAIESKKQFVIHDSFIAPSDADLIKP